jgi:NADP-dependent 3-hydroxy acid dehydrogenase YdfG
MFERLEALPDLSGRIVVVTGGSAGVGRRHALLRPARRHNRHPRARPRRPRRVTKVTYLGCVHGTMAALRHMLRRDRGVIV